MHRIAFNGHWGRLFIPIFSSRPSPLLYESENKHERWIMCPLMAEADEQISREKVHYGCWSEQETWKPNLLAAKADMIVKNKWKKVSKVTSTWFFIHRARLSPSAVPIVVPVGKHAQHINPLTEYSGPASHAVRRQPHGKRPLSLSLSRRARAYGRRAKNSTTKKDSNCFFLLTAKTTYNTNTCLPDCHENETESKLIVGRSIGFGSGWKQKEK